MKRVHVTFPSGDITLEGVWHLPETSSPLPAVIVCHPHPLYGGDMNSNVVFAICQALAEEGIAALRFNFRGAGNSGGSYSNGIGERDDLKCALDYTSTYPGIDPAKLGVAGYSFGAGVAAPVAVRDSRIKLITLVSPALSENSWDELKTYSYPKFLIAGEADFVFPLPQFQHHVKQVAQPAEFDIIRGADHFWGGYEGEIAPKIARFFATGFQRLTPP